MLLSSHHQQVRSRLHVYYYPYLEFLDKLCLVLVVAGRACTSEPGGQCRLCVEFNPVPGAFGNREPNLCWSMNVNGDWRLFSSTHAHSSMSIDLPRLFFWVKTTVNNRGETHLDWAATLHSVLARPPLRLEEHDRVDLFQE